MEHIRIKIEDLCNGVLFHNNRIVDPTDSFARHFKNHSPKSNSSIEEHYQHNVMQWFAGIYTNIPIECENGKIVVDDDTKLIIPQKMLQSCFKSGAATMKLGKKFSAGCFVTSNAEFTHDKSKLSFKEQANICRLKEVVKVGMGSRIVRCRPEFHRWSAEFEILVNNKLINKRDAIEAITIAGQMCGIGDWRPGKSGIYGQFSVEEL